MRVSDIKRSPEIFKRYLKQLASTISCESEDLYLRDSYVFLAFNIYFYRRFSFYCSQYKNNDETNLTRSERTVRIIINEIIIGFFLFLGSRSFLVFNAMTGMYHTIS